MNSTADHSQEDPRLVQALEEYVAARQAGQTPDRQAFLERYREIADALAECLDGLELVHVAGPQLQRPASEASLGAATGVAGVAAGMPLGDYLLLREVGRGGMGIVYEAEQLSLRRRVAVKVLPFAASLDPKQLRRFQNEAEAAAQLHHTNIVPVFGVGCERGVHFYAMQFIEGRTLAAVIHELRHLAGKQETPRGGAGSAAAGGTPEAPAAAADTDPNLGAGLSTFPSLKPLASFRMLARLGVQVAEALEHAHDQGVLHRDIKPANLLVDERGKLWVTDFGLARFHREAGLTLTGDVLGTLRYMSPEQARGRRDVVDHRSDIYSLGVTLYELLTLEPACPGHDREEVRRQIQEEEPRPPRDWNPAIPRELETIVLKALAKHPQERYGTAQELADDLERFLKDEPIRARRPTVMQRARKWARRHRPVLATALASTFAGLALAVAVLAVDNVRIKEATKRTELEKQKAEEALQRERQTREKLEQSQYYRCIQGANSEWSTINFAVMEELLDECPARLRHWEWHYLKRLRHAALLTLRGHTGRVRSALFSPDGRRLASVSAAPDATIRVWELTTGQLLHTLRGSAAGSVVAFSPDGRRVLSAAGTRIQPGGRARSISVTVWDLDTGRDDRTVELQTGPVSVMACSPDGQRLAWAGGDQTVKVWDVETGREQLTLAGQTETVEGIAFSPDGRLLASGGARGSVKAWDMTTGQEVCTLLPGHDGRVSRLAFSPDGRLLASAGKDTTVRVWDVARQREVFTFRRHTREVTGLVFSPDGRRLASTARLEHVVKVWEPLREREVLQIRGHISEINDVAFSPDGRHLASVSDDQTVQVWDALAGSGPRTWTGRTGVHGVAFSPDGRLLASAGEDQTITIRDTTTGQETATLRGHTAAVWGVAFAPDSRRLASAGADQVVRIWDVNNREEITTLKQDGTVWGVAFSPDGRRLASAGDDGTVRVWDPETRRVIFRLPGQGHPVRGVAFSPDGGLLAAACWGGPHAGVVKVWDATTGREWRTLHKHAFEVNQVAFSPDGRRLVSTGGDKKVIVWEVATGRDEFTLHGHDGGVVGVAFSPDGRRLATASRDWWVKIWDMNTQQRVLSLGHDDRVWGVAFSPDGRYVASASADGTVKVWNGTPWPE